MPGIPVLIDLPERSTNTLPLPRTAIVGHRPFRQARPRAGCAGCGCSCTRPAVRWCQDRAHLCDQRLVERASRSAADASIASRVGSSASRIGRRPRRGHGGAKDRPSSHAMHLVTVHRPLPPEDQVDLQRLVEEIRLVQVGLRSGLQAGQQARQQQSVERAVVGCPARRRRSCRPGRDPKVSAIGAERLTLVVAAMHGAQRVERRQDRAASRYPSARASATSARLRVVLIAAARAPSSIIPRLPM